MAKFLIEYELKANIANFKKEAGNATGEVSKINLALDKSVEGVKSIVKGKNLEKYFDEANKSAKQLKKTILELENEQKKGTAKDDPRIRGLQQSIEAGKLQYANDVSRITPEANLVRARYALYDIANEARRVGAIMTGLSLAVAKVGVDFQRSFIDVERTTGLLGTELENLRKSLIAISTSTSVSFADISKLATLAAQMGIESENIAEFSKTVAMFSTVTGVGVDVVTQSLGRIAQMLNVASDEYDNLGSSILYAGRNSIATEAEILAVTTQIAASAQQAGFLAEEAVGLGTALASLRIQPEMARGVILRLFADFDSAMAKNGKELQDYASLLGMSTEATRALYDSGGPEFFVKLTEALGKAQEAGLDMNVALSAMGITNTREVATLEKLVGNHDLLVKSLNDAGTAFKENTDLNEQYEKVMATAAEQIKRLQNNLAALSDSASGPILGALTVTITALNDSLETLTQIPGVGFIVGLTAAVGLGIGVFLLYKAAILQATATIFANRVAMRELGVTSLFASTSLRNLVGALLGIVPAGKATHVTLGQITAALAGAGTGARTLAFVLRAIPFVAIGSMVYMLAEQMINFKDASTRAKDAAEAFKQEILNTEDLTSLDLFKDRNSLFEKVFSFDGPKIQKEIDGVRQSVTSLQEALIILQRGESENEGGKRFFIVNFDKSKAQIEKLNTIFEDLVSSGNYQEANDLMGIISEQAGKIGISTQELNTIFPGYQENLTKVAAGLEEVAATDAAEEIRTLSDVVKQDLTAAFIAPQKNISDFNVATLDFLQALKDSENGINVFSEDGRNAFKGFETIINAIIEKAGPDLTEALTGSAAAIQIVEQAGGDASSQLGSLVEELNKEYDIKLNSAAFSTLDQLRQAILTTAGISASARAEIGNLLSGGQYTDVFSSIFAKLQKSISNTSKAARKEVKTVFDYVGQLRGVFDNITDLAFATSVATDNAADGWDSVTRSANSAKESIAGIQKELSDMTTERASLSAQLDIAKRYGDVAEIRRITAEIAALDSKMAKSQEELTYQEGKSSLILKGNTRAARENRSEIRARVEESKALITSYAQTAKANGKLPTQAEVAAYAKTIATGFKNQATEIGFSADELTDYVKVITGFGKAANAVTPPNVKVTLDPVTTAIEAYLAKNKKTDVTIDGNTDDLKQDINDLQKDANNLLKAIQPPMRRMIIDPSDVKLYRRALEKGHISPAEYDKAVYGRTLRLSKGGKGFYAVAQGGYISGPGTATSDSIPAMLSDGEYVIKAAAVDRYGVGFFDSLNQMKSGSAAPAAAPQVMASGSSSVVYLSEQDRALLRKAIDRPISLYTTDRKIAESANSGNKELARRGSK